MFWFTAHPGNILFFHGAFDPQTSHILIFHTEFSTPKRPSKLQFAKEVLVLEMQRRKGHEQDWSLVDAK
jgi:hypothetical protein